MSHMKSLVQVASKLQIVGLLILQVVGVFGFDIAFQVQTPPAEYFEHFLYAL